MFSPVSRARSTARRWRGATRPPAALATALSGALAGVLLLAGCGADLSPPEEGFPRNPQERRDEESLFGEGGLTLFGREREEDTGAGGGVAVNSFLWRASLDTISFLPLQLTDPFGGVITTDWHSLPESPNERFKITVYISSRALRADGLGVRVFRQVRRGQDWADADVDPAVATEVENAILTRARQLRLAALNRPE